MCGRFLFTQEQSKEIDEIIREVQQRVDEYEFEQIRFGEVFPTNHVPVLSQNGDSVEPIIMEWGFPPVNKRRMINARAETVAARPMFQDSFYNRRCVIPINAFGTI